MPVTCGGLARLCDWTCDYCATAAWGLYIDEATAENAYATHLVTEHHLPYEQAAAEALAHRNAVAEMLAGAQRCATCRHWRCDGKDAYGECCIVEAESILVPPTTALALITWCSDGPHALITRNDFGCVQWEARAGTTTNA